MWPFGTRAPIVPLCWSQRRHRAGPPAAWRVETDGGGVGHAARSAFARLTREARLTAEERSRAVARLAQFGAAWDEILLTEKVRALAEKLARCARAPGGRRRSTGRCAGVMP
jgi:hypothetical protein